MNRMFGLQNRPIAVIIAAVIAVFLVSHSAAQTPIPAEKSKRMIITIGSSTFVATLDDNATAAEFKARLPMTLKMSELNGNEKYFRLKHNLPTKASNPGKIQAGDLMIYGSNTLVLFYETFSTSYSYTRLGAISDTAGLVAAVGSADVTVTFALE
jgi:hypothetical protein